VFYLGIVIVVASSLSLGSAGYLQDDTSFYMLALVARLLQGAQAACFNTTNRVILLNISKTKELASLRMSYYVIIAALGNAAGPILTAYMSEGLTFMATVISFGLAASALQLLLMQYIH
jgi:hypothetical protein